MSRFCLIGPTYPYRGGIAHYTTLLALQLQQAHDVLLLSFSQQYPAWLFPGRTDRDPSNQPLRAEAEYLLNPLNPISWWQTVRRVKAWQPDIVVLPWWVLFWLPVWAVLSRAIKRTCPQARLLFICHNVLPHDPHPLVKRGLPLLLKLAIGAGDGYVVHSKSDGRLLRTIFPHAHTQQSPHPTYAQISTTQSTLPVSIPTDKPLLLFCGLIRPYKGLDILLEALPHVTQPYHLLVAGEFWQGGYAQTEAQIKQLNLQEQVTIIDDYLPNESLLACIQQADVVVLPYRSATQSGILQVAFGQETPVIITRVGGLPDVVDDGQTGLIVPPEDPHALAHAINQFLAHQMGSTMQEAIREANGRFSWSHLINTLTQLAQQKETL